MKPLTRRQLLAATATSALVPTLGMAPALGAATMEAQTPPAAPDWAKAAREANQRNAEALAKVDLPIATEPAFAFKA